MGKRIVSQARGKGGFTYRVRRKAYKYKIGYPANVDGPGVVVKLLNSGAHSAPLAKILVAGKIFYNPAAQGLYEGQKIGVGEGTAELGNVLPLKSIPFGTKVFNIEKRPGDGGKMLRSSGTTALVTKRDKGKIFVSLSKKKEVSFNEDCKATIGIVAGQGRVMKPIIKAGKKYKMMKARSKKWPLTSAVKVNAVDHPFGGGRGKRIKSKIAKRNAPPGRKVGHIRPRRTGRR